MTYQCSQLSTPQSITDVFKSAQNLQTTDDSQVLSLLVLDEVGLAEDSPSFPLKALHPLLEDGTDGLGTDDKVQSAIYAISILFSVIYICVSMCRIVT